MPSGIRRIIFDQRFITRSHRPWDLTDWFYVVLTIVVFAFLLLILKGIESFER